MIVRRKPTIPVTDPASVANVLQELLKQEDMIDRDKEHFYSLHLDTRSRVKLIEVVSIGTVNASLVHPRETFRRAVHEGTTSLVIAHNHPSGDVSPSDEDIKVTQRLVEAGKILDIAVLDHIIFSDKAYFSMKGELMF